MSTHMYTLTHSCGRSYKTNPSLSVVDPNPLFHLVCWYIFSLLSRLIPPFPLHFHFSVSMQEDNARGLIPINAEAGGNFFLALCI